FAVVQLRHEDRRGLLYNLVGFQTKLRVGEQKRVFRRLPGMAGAVFARFGSVHRNTYVNAPRQLTDTLELRARPGLFLAGQMAGVEGYVESAALGYMVGVNALCRARGETPPRPDPRTAHGALLAHLREASPKGFQPMNVNYGLFPPLEDAPRRLPKREKNARLADRALGALASYADAVARARPGAA
ncbi:MAG: FAD-dependent oxidoreductase, partial [Myxococcota bacterium]|nr:FAD-dependent oxidoreductase [Myxococcota bacterium]